MHSKNSLNRCRIHRQPLVVVMTSGPAAYVPRETLIPEKPISRLYLASFDELFMKFMDNEIGAEELRDSFKLLCEDFAERGIAKKIQYTPVGVKLYFTLIKLPDGSVRVNGVKSLETGKKLHDALKGAIVGL